MGEHAPHQASAHPIDGVRGGPEGCAVRCHGRAIISFVTVVRSVLLFLLAALAEIGGAWLVWQGVREHRGLLWAGAGVVALGLYGFVATLQPDAHFGRILAAYGGVFVVGSLLWGVVLDGFRPDRLDYVGAALCLAGVVVIMYVPRG
jgi:small multidrug resistance family-3 protein